MLVFHLGLDLQSLEMPLAFVISRPPDSLGSLLFGIFCTNNMYLSIQYAWHLGHPVFLVPVVPRADLSKVGLVQYEWPVWSLRSRRYQLLISSVFGVHLPGLW
jgi:hypothetical protein